MNIICRYDQTRFTLTKDEIIAILETMYTDNLRHYAARCPRCGHANAISIEDLRGAIGFTAAIDMPARASVRPPQLGVPVARNTRIGDRIGCIYLLIMATAIMLCSILSQLLAPAGRLDRVIMHVSGSEGHPAWNLAKPFVCGDRNLKIVRLPLGDTGGQSNYSRASYHAYCVTNGSAAGADVILQVRLVAGAIQGAMFLALCAALWAIIMIGIKLQKSVANKTAGN